MLMPIKTVSTEIFMSFEVFAFFTSRCDLEGQPKMGILRSCHAKNTITQLSIARESSSSTSPGLVFELLECIMLFQTSVQAFSSWDSFDEAFIPISWVGAGAADGDARRAAAV